MEGVIQDPFEDDTDNHSEEVDEGALDLADDDDDETEDENVTLDALEAEEFETVETSESATILVDEASELMAIRRKEMTIDVDAEVQQGDEFVCRSCFLLLKKVQLVDRQDMLCVDCA